MQWSFCQISLLRERKNYDAVEEPNELLNTQNIGSNIVYFNRATEHTTVASSSNTTDSKGKGQDTAMLSILLVMLSHHIEYASQLQILA